MKRLETIKNKGTITSNNGERVAVRYEIHVYQKDDIPAGHYQDPSATIPSTLKHYEGKVSPVCFYGENGLLLEMKDGRKAKFFYLDNQGSISVQWMG